MESLVVSSGDVMVSSGDSEFVHDNVTSLDALEYSDSVSSGDISSSGDVTIATTETVVVSPDYEEIVQLFNFQIQAVQEGFTVLFIFLGLIAGMLFMKGFWTAKEG